MGAPYIYDISHLRVKLLAYFYYRRPSSSTNDITYFSTSEGSLHKIKSNFTSLRRGYYQKKFPLSFYDL
jgi:hypothetical protein